MVELLIVLFLFKSEEYNHISKIDTMIQKEHMVPEATELWDPVPNIVDPGKNFSDAPSDAIILFDGSNLNSWVHKDGSEANWSINDGYFTVKPGTGSILSKQYFGSCQLHIEFMTPKEIVSEGQGRGNSGVYFMEDPNQTGDSGYEIQVLDSYNNRTYSNGQAGSVYKQHIPLVNASKKPGDWQSYDIIFKAPIFNDNGSLESPAYVTVFHNGVLIQNNVEIKRPTMNIEKGTRKTLILQDHDKNGTVSYRNIWMRKI